MTQVIAGNHTAAIVAVFVCATIEAVAVLGTLFPGTVILMTIAGAGAISGQSMLPYLAAAILGAVLGDGLSYATGRLFHQRVRQVWPFRQRPALMDSAERFFVRFGVGSVLLCRFIPVLRSNLPLFAGMANMPSSRFFVANIASALLWAPLHIYPAQMAGLSLSRLAAGDWRGAAFWAAVLLAGGMAGWAVHQWAGRLNRRRASRRG